MQKLKKRFLFLVHMITGHIHLILLALLIGYSWYDYCLLQRHLICLFRDTVRQKCIFPGYSPYTSKKLKLKPTIRKKRGSCRINMPPVDGSSPFPLLPRMCLDLRGTEDALFIHMCFSVSRDAQHFLEKPQCDDLTFHMSDDATIPVLPSNNHSSPQSHDPQKTSENVFWLTFVKTHNVLTVYFSCPQASFLIFCVPVWNCSFLLVLAYGMC